MAAEKIYDLWASRNPQWEKRYEDSIIKNFCDYGRGATSLREERGKVFGGGYEIFIVAFFIGLYFNQKRPLIGDTQKRKTFGQPIQYWGNLDSKKGRKAYPKLREYMFMTLVARTPEIDWIALDKGQRTVGETVNLLMITMEEYINYGLSVLAEKIKNDESYFYSKNSFLDIFKDLTKEKQRISRDSEEEPESLD